MKRITKKLLILLVIGLFAASYISTIANAEDSVSANKECPVNSHFFNGLCLCNDGYVIMDKSDNTCITIDEGCKKAYGENSHWHCFMSEGVMLRGCELGYKRVEENGELKCVKDYEAAKTRLIDREKLLTKNIDIELSKKLKGRILLQVEMKGEAWYVNPDDMKKYYLGQPTDAFNLMRKFGLGIKHQTLINYLGSKFPSRLSGKILLDVEQNGEAYYVNFDLKGSYLERPSDAYRIMRESGLGITNNDIRKIGIGEIK